MLPLFLRYTSPNQIKANAKTRLSSYKTEEIYKKTRDLYKMLSDKLGDKPFFYGDAPTTLDAVAYAHLSLHSFPTLSNPNLFSMLAFEFPTLISYVTRIKSEFLYAPFRVAADDQSLREWFMDWFREKHGEDEEARKVQRVETFKRAMFGLGGLAFFITFFIKKVCGLLI